MSDAAAWIEAGATCVLAIGGIGAFVYAVRTYRAQAAQLGIAQDDSSEQRTPVLHGELRELGTGVQRCRLDVRLLSPEPLISLAVTIVETRAGDCPLGFTVGQSGVAPYPDEATLPVGWKNDVMRHLATWSNLMPGSAATWDLAPRDLQSDGKEPVVLRLRTECFGPGGTNWIVPIEEAAS